jgi:hypothetical protein
MKGKLSNEFGIFIITFMYSEQNIFIVFVHHSYFKISTYLFRKIRISIYKAKNKNTHMKHNCKRGFPHEGRCNQKITVDDRNHTSVSCFESMKFQL